MEDGTVNASRAYQALDHMLVSVREHAWPNVPQHVRTAGLHAASLSPSRGSCSGRFLSSQSISGPGTGQRCEGRPSGFIAILLPLHSCAYPPGRGINIVA